MASHRSVINAAGGTGSSPPWLISASVATIAHDTKNAASRGLFVGDPVRGIIRGESYASRAHKSIPESDDGLSTSQSGTEFRQPYRAEGILCNVICALIARVHVREWL